MSTRSPLMADLPDASRSATGRGVKEAQEAPRAPLPGCPPGGASPPRDPGAATAARDPHVMWGRDALGISGL